MASSRSAVLPPAVASWVSSARTAQVQLPTIVDQAAKVSDLTRGISQASQEKAQGVDQVNVAVSQMDKVTQLSSTTPGPRASIR